MPEESGKMVRARHKITGEQIILVEYTETFESSSGMEFGMGLALVYVDHSSKRQLEDWELNDLEILGSVEV